MFRTVAVPGLCIVAGWLALVTLVPVENAQARNKETVLYSLNSFAASGGEPYAPVIEDKKGNLYGTTSEGGKNESGTVFKLAPDGTETTLYSFPAYSGDGLTPQAGLLADPSGNLYGTTEWGGEYNSGVVFELSRNGTESVLYSFCSQSNCADGLAPHAGLVDVNGTLYGTTPEGGTGTGGDCIGGCGTVFSLDPTTGEETVLHSFGSRGDGAHPFAGLLVDSKGNLYGTTESGGTKGGGTVFKITPDGAETVLYSFCSQINCTDGAEPAVASLIEDSSGNLYGTTLLGGSDDLNCRSFFFLGCGTIFRLAPDGTETVLYAFCSQTDCADGALPLGVVADLKGNLYGTTSSGGPKCCANGGYGIVFKLAPDGTETILHTFCSRGVCTDGDIPGAGLTRNSKGTLYGTTAAGGSYGGGVVFELTKRDRVTR